MFKYFIFAFFLCCANLFAIIPSVFFKDVSKYFDNLAYSPTVGKIAIDSGFIYNLRFFGNFEKGLNTQGKWNPVADKGNDPIMRLTIKLFPSLPYQLTTENMGQESFGKQTSIQQIAEMLTFVKEVYAIIEKHQGNVQKARKTLDQIPGTYRGKFKKNKTLINEALATLLRDAVLYEYSNALAPASTPTALAKRTSSPSSRGSSPVSEDDERSASRGSSPVSEDDERSASRGSSPASNDDETSASIESIYPRYTTAQIILAFFTQHFSSKQDIIDLISALSKDVEDAKDGTSQWDPSSVDATMKMVTENPDYVPSLDFIYFYSFYDLGSPIPYKNGMDPLGNGSGCQAYDRVNDQFLPTTFADCHETAIRHFTNMILFDQESKTFKLPQITTPAWQKMEDFYASQKPVDANNGDSNFRSQWNRVVGDLNATQGRPEIQYVDRTYNLNSGFKNFIYVWKKLLGDALDLSPLPTNKDTAWKWVSESLQKIIKILNPDLKNVRISIQNFREDYNYKRTDRDYYGEATINVTNKIGQSFTFTLSQSVGHIMMKRIQYDTQQKKLLDLIRHLPNIGTCQLLNAESSRIYKILGIHKLDDNDQKINILKINKDIEDVYVPLLKNVVQTLDLGDDYVRLQLQRTVEQTDFNQNAYQILIQVASDGIKNPKTQYAALDLFKALFEKDYQPAFDVAIQAASDGMKNQNVQIPALGMKNQNVQIPALNLFKALFEKGQGFSAAAQAASEGMQNSDFWTRNSALELFQALVEKSYQPAFEAAAQAASDGMKNPNAQNVALLLYKALVEKGYQPAFEAAIQAASEGMQNPKTQNAALLLYKALVEKGQVFEAAAQAASEEMQNSDSSTRDSARDLFKALFEKGYQPAFDVAIQAASKGMKNQDTQLSALDLFKALFEKGYQPAFSAATQVASDGMKNPKTQYAALLLYKALVEKGYQPAFDVAIQVALKGMQNPNTQYVAPDLFKALFARVSAILDQDEAERDPAFEKEKLKRLFEAEYNTLEAKKNSRNLSEDERMLHQNLKAVLQKF